MDLNIENVGLVEGWSPPVGNVLSPGFKAVMKSLRETFLSHGGLQCEQGTQLTRLFIDKLEQKGYCIALLPQE